MTITWTTFAIRLLVGFFLAVGIGIERQWLKTRAVLKTNVLVTLGSAMFVMLSIMTPEDSSPTRVASQIVSGVGFLGGGVILRQGASIKGINTAATLWCAAAIGTLVGSGFLVQAYVSTLAVVGANLLLRPLVEAFKQREDREDIMDDRSFSQKNPDTTSENGKNALLSSPNRYHYSCYLICSPKVEAKALDLVIKFAKEKDLVTTMVESKNAYSTGALKKSAVEIKINFADRVDSEPLINSEEIILMLKAEAEVSSVSWKLI